MSLVTIGLGWVGVKANLDNVTNYDGVFLKASLSVRNVSEVKVDSRGNNTQGSPPCKI